MAAPMLRTLTKWVADAVAMLVASPLGALSGVERALRPGHEGMFHFCAHVVAVLPGVPGALVRRAFYRQALDACHADCHIGFGAMFTHREVVVEKDVYVGPWALIGSARLREGTSIGSRASLTSGTELHEFRDGRWTPYDATKLRQIAIGPHTLVGEAAVVMAEVGAGALVAAGAVVASDVPGGVAVAGNPARFVRRLDAPARPPVETPEAAP